MDVLLFSTSLPTSTRLTYFVRRNLSRGRRNRKIQLCCSNLGNSGDAAISQITSRKSEFYLSRRRKSRRNICKPPRCNYSSSSDGSSEDKEDSSETQKAPFGYSRKDVLLIGVGLTALGVGLKYGLEFVGVDPLKAGNVVQLVMVLGLTIGWISTYIFRVSNKDMTYAKQLRDYEKKVMEKRLESLTEAELEALLEQVEEEKGG